MQPSSPPVYNLGYTAGSLRPNLARIIAEAFLSVGDWERAKESVLASNRLQSKARTSSVRLERELRQRLQTLTDEELTLLAEGTAEDRIAMAWLAALKHLAFVFDFTVEVLREKLAVRDQILRPSDYESYLDKKSSLHPELEALAPTSKKKIRQVLLRMLFEAGLLSHGDTFPFICRPTISPSAYRAVVRDDPSWLAGFLVSDAEITSI